MSLKLKIKALIQKILHFIFKYKRENKRLKEIIRLKEESIRYLKNQVKILESEMDYLNSINNLPSLTSQNPDSYVVTHELQVPKFISLTDKVDVDKHHFIVIVHGDKEIRVNYHISRTAFMFHHDPEILLGYVFKELSNQILYYLKKEK